MSRISAPAAIRLFARVAFTRTLNRSTLLRKLRIGTAKSSDSSLSDTAPSEATRTATQHRDVKQSWGKRLAGPAFLALMTAGWVMFCVSAVFALLDFARLQDLTADIAADRPIMVEKSHYEALDAAIADRSEETTKHAVSSAFDSVPTWMTEEANRVVLERIKQRGIASFVSVAHPADEAPAWRGAAALLSPEARREAFASVGLYLFVGYTALIAMGLGLSSKSLTQADPALTWMMQFPVSRRVLFSAKVVECAVEGPTVVIAAAISVALAYVCGFSFLGGAVFALVCGISTALATGAIRVALEIGLLQLCTRKQRGAIVSCCSVLGGLCLFYVMFMSNSRLTLELLPALASRLPSALFWNPLSQGFGTAAQLQGFSSGWWIAGPIGGALLSVAAVAFSVRLTKHGLAPGQDSLRDDHISPARASADADASMRASYFSGMVRKELLQIRRQPERIGQIMLAPLFVAFLLFLNGPNSTVARAVQGSEAICAAIFVGATYMLLVAVSQTLTAELKTLWFLQCQPKSIAESIRVKARVWGIAAILMTLIALGATLVFLPHDWPQILARVPFMLAATWIMAEITFGTMTLAATIVNDQTIRFRRTTLLIPSILMTTAASAVYTGELWGQFVLLVVMGMLNVAVRQKQEAELGWLSEPAENPPRRLYAMNGLVAIVGFLFLRDLLKPPLYQLALTNASILAIAYCGSAAIMGIGTWIWVKRLGFHVLPVRTADASRPSIAKPIVVGLVVTCLVGLAWQSFIRAAIKSEGPMVLTPSWQADATGSYVGPWLLIFMIVLAAPIFEEWLFRGLLYRSLRQSSGVSASITGTSLLFTVVHPLTSSVAVLVLGVVAAWLVEKTGRLWPSMLVHIGYNLFVVVMWNVMG